MTSLEPKEAPERPAIMEMATMEQVKSWMDRFRKLKEDVIMSNPNFYTKLTIRGKERVLINRSGWRAVQLTFNLNDTIIKTERIIHPDGKNWTERIFVRVWHETSGRSVEGVGACSSDEPSKIWQHPIHDIFATAHTRAKNRAISDIVGSGEVSSEEMDAIDTPVLTTAEAKAREAAKAMGVKPHGCAHCNKTFSTIEEVEKHSISTHPGKPVYPTRKVPTP